MLGEQALEGVACHGGKVEVVSGRGIGCDALDPLDAGPPPSPVQSVVEAICRVAFWIPGVQHVVEGGGIGVGQHRDSVVPATDAIN